MPDISQDLIDQAAQLCVLPEPEFNYPDRRVVTLWRLSWLIVSGVLLLMFGAVTGVWFFFEWPGRWLVLTLAMVVVVLSVIWSFWYPERGWRTHGWRLDRSVLVVREGVWFRVVRLLPLNRLQHVDLHRGPINRYCGLASLVLHTAGTHAASIRITGLDAEDAAHLRDRLIELGGVHGG